MRSEPRSSVDERARTTAALAAVEALFSTGRTDEAVALADATLSIARRRRDELPHAEPVLLGMRAVALRLAGHLVEATTLSENNYALLVPRRSAVATAVEANMLGLIWLARGRVRTALRFCRESAALLRDGDAVGCLPSPRRASPRPRRRPARRKRRAARSPRWSARRWRTRALRSSWS